MTDLEGESRLSAPKPWSRRAGSGETGLSANGQQDRQSGSRCKAMQRSGFYALLLRLPDPALACRQVKGDEPVTQHVAPQIAVQNQVTHHGAP